MLDGVMDLVHGGILSEKKKPIVITCKSHDNYFVSQNSFDRQNSRITKI